MNKEIISVTWVVVRHLTNLIYIIMAWEFRFGYTDDYDNSGLEPLLCARRDPSLRIYLVVSATTFLVLSFFYIPNSVTLSHAR